MKLAMLTPLPPMRTGVAHYASMLLPALAQRADVTAFASLDGYHRADFDAVIYQLGNNPYHEPMYQEAMRDPGIVVLHDLVMHHLIVEMTLARGDAEAYVEALRENHGEAGEAWARGRAAGLHSELGNFLLPASIEVARRAQVVIVHNRYAHDRLRSFGVGTPIEVVPHPYLPETRTFDRAALRARLGIDAAARVIGVFGFLTSAKRAEVVLEAFRLARRQMPELRLLIVGEPAPNIDPDLLREEGVITTGYVADEEFAAWYAIADRLVNLRYPSAGETSGTLIRAFDAGRPVAVSDYAQFAELPADCVVRIPLGGTESTDLAAFFTGDLDVPAIAARQRRWLESNASLDLTVEGYLRAVRLATSAKPTAGAAAGVQPITRALPLFPRLALVASSIRPGTALLTLRNTGESVLRARTYGAPELKLVAKLFASGRVIDDRWLSLPGDVAPDGTFELEVPLARGGDRLRIEYALQDVPSVGADVAFEVEVSPVR